MEQIQIYEAKLDLEKQISALLAVFYAQTGRLVISVDPGSFDITGVDDTLRKYVFNSRVILTNP